MRYVPHLVLLLFSWSWIGFCELRFYLMAKSLGKGLTGCEGVKRPSLFLKPDWGSMDAGLGPKGMSSGRLQPNLHNSWWLLDMARLTSLLLTLGTYAVGTEFQPRFKVRKFWLSNSFVGLLMFCLVISKTTIMFEFFLKKNSFCINVLYACFLQLCLLLYSFAFKISWRFSFSFMSTNLVYVYAWWWLSPITLFL